HRGDDVRDHYLRGYVTLAKPDVAQLDPATTTPARHRAAGPGGGYRNDANGAPPVVAKPAAANATTKTGDSAGDDEWVAAELEAGKKKEKGEETRLGGKSLPDDGEAQGEGGQGTSIAIRSNFNPLAAFAPAVKTDGAGRAKVSVKVPDNLTRYRIVAIATAGEKQFGKGESAITARLPLMVRPSPPRFLNFGDTFQLPVVVQNQTDAPMTVRLAARTANAALTDGAGREVTVTANDRVEVQFPAAAELAGTARFQIVGSAGKASDAAEVALPVWTPATTEAFATYGVIDAGAIKQPVALPGKVVTQFGGLEVTTASTNLAALTDAMLYLVRYPFECAEQRSSRILGIAALKDVLGAFHAKDLPSVSAMQASVATDIERLSQMQNGDGGFAFWDRGFPSEPYLTVYVASALGLAQKKGFAVPAGIVDRARPYLRDIESHYPHYYSKEVRWAISAFTLYVRKQLGDVDIDKAKRLIATAGGVDKLSMEANGWLLATLAQSAAAADERK